jgi:peptide/nickel transport system permease protein
VLRYTLQRLLLAIPTLLGITLISFAVMRLAPGDPVDLFLGGAAGGQGLSTERGVDIEETRRQLRHQLGLDRPLYMQYFHWLGKLLLQAPALDGYDRAALLADKTLDVLDAPQRQTLRALPSDNQRRQFLEHLQRLYPAEAPFFIESAFWRGKGFNLEKNYHYTGAGLELFVAGGRRWVTLDFGRSFKDQQPVIGRILERLPITIEISAISLFLAYLIGVPLGVLLAAKQNSRADRILTTGTFALWSLPSFWLGMLLIVFFCNREFLYWFPAAGIQSLQASADWGLWRLLKDHLHHLFLPVLTSTYTGFAGISRYMRTSMLENIRLDYVRTARAKGLREKTVILRHVLRNSLIPLVTLLAGLLPGLIAGSVFVETIFTIPGMGFLGFQSVIVRDYPVVMAIFTIGAALSLAGVLCADILLKAVDPRIDFGGGRS